MPPMPLSHKIDWTFAATHAASASACASAEAWARAAGLPEMLILRLVLLIEELFTNTIKHGYHSESNRPVRIALGYNGGHAELEYCDQAPPFDPISNVEHVADYNPPAHIGGMGLKLIQTLGCKASYSNEDGWNIVRMMIGDHEISAQAESLIHCHEQMKRHDPPSMAAGPSARDEAGG